MKDYFTKPKSVKWSLVIFYLTIVIVLNTYLYRHLEQIVTPEISSFATSTAIVSGSEIISGNVAKKQVIFTFDGGSSITSADKILKTLAKYGVKGTFFLTGKFIENNPELVRKIASGGNEIFNHTYDHPHLTKLLDSQVAEELNKTEKLLLNVSGISPKPYFRAPFGDRNSRILKIAQKLGYQSVYWTVDALDWKEKEGETAEQVKKIIISNLKPGNIYLVHIGDSISGNILDAVFETIKKQGYAIVPLTQGI